MNDILEPPSEVCEVILKLLKNNQDTAARHLAAEYGFDIHLSEGRYPDGKTGVVIDFKQRSETMSDTRWKKLAVLLALLALIFFAGIARGQEVTTKTMRLDTGAWMYLGADDNWHFVNAEVKSQFPSRYFEKMVDATTKTFTVGYTDAMKVEQEALADGYTTTTVHAMYMAMLAEMQAKFDRAKNLGLSILPMSAWDMYRIDLHKTRSLSKDPDVDPMSYPVRIRAGGVVYYLDVTVMESIERYYFVR